MKAPNPLHFSAVSALSALALALALPTDAANLSKPGQQAIGGQSSPPQGSSRGGHWERGSGNWRGDHRPGPWHGRGHDRWHRHWSWGVFWGAPLWWGTYWSPHYGYWGSRYYPYYGGYYYSPYASYPDDEERVYSRASNVPPEPTTEVPVSAEGAPTERPLYLNYCEESKAYYPKVTTCKSGWQMKRPKYE